MPVVTSNVWLNIKESFLVWVVYYIMAIGVQVGLSGCHLILCVCVCVGERRSVYVCVCVCVCVLGCGYVFFSISLKSLRCASHSQQL